MQLAQKIVDHETDIRSKEGAQHGMDIIAAVSVEKHSIYYTEADKIIGTILILL